MVLAGVQFAQLHEITSQEIARLTLQTLQRTVPPAVPGIVFLSGGQSEQEATANLAAINALAQKSRSPWSLSFSYGRALQQSVLREWAGADAGIGAAQKQLLFRAECNSKATQGIFKAEDKNESSAASKQSAFVPNYKY